MVNILDEWMHSLLVNIIMFLTGDKCNIGLLLFMGYVFLPLSKIVCQFLIFYAINILFPYYFCRTALFASKARSRGGTPWAFRVTKKKYIPIDFIRSEFNRELF